MEQQQVPDSNPVPVPVPMSEQNLPPAPMGSPAVVLHSKPSWLWPVVFIVVVAVIGGVVFQALKHLPAGQRKVIISNTLPKGYSSAIVGPGSYPPGFPLQFVYEAAVKPFRGESTVTGSGQNQKIVEYFSSSTPDVIYNIYKTGLLKAGGKAGVDISNQPTKVLQFNMSTLGIFQVIIVPLNKGSQVKLVSIT